MRRGVSRRGVALMLLFVVVGACTSGPPGIDEVKMGKTEDVAQTTTSFDSTDTLYSVATIDNPPADGEVVGRLVVVDVEGQEAGPIPGLESTLSLTGGLNTANFKFSPPDAGWPNGTYQLDVILLDGSGAEKDKKTANFATTGNQSAPASASGAPDEDGSTATEEQTSNGAETQSE